MQIFSDNTATVEAINSHSSRLKESGHLLQSLAFLIAYYQCELIAKYLSGKRNTLADALSCHNKSLFLSPYPQAQRTATPIPAELLHLLIIEQPKLDVTSLDRAVVCYFDSSIAPSTARTYRVGMKNTKNYVNSYRQTQHLHLNNYYVDSVLASYNTSHNTIKVYLAAVKQLHLQQGYRMPALDNMPRLNQVLLGIKVNQAG